MSSSFRRERTVSTVAVCVVGCGRCGMFRWTGNYCRTEHSRRRASADFKDGEESDQNNADGYVMFHRLLDSRRFLPVRTVLVPPIADIRCSYSARCCLLLPEHTAQRCHLRRSFGHRRTHLSDRRDRPTIEQSKFAQHAHGRYKQRGNQRRLVITKSSK